MVHAGAAGGTRDELGRALGLPYGGDELAGAWRDLKRALPNPLVLEDTAAVFLVASLWHQRGIPLRRKYLEGEERTFGPSVFPAAFRGSVLGASKAMESWILRVTGVRMGGIVPYRPGPGTVMVLVSSLSFTGLWREAFPEDGIRRGFFRLGEERHVEVGFQRRAGMYRYMEDGAGQAVEIPYRRGRYTMTVLLGAGGGDGDLAALERDASPEALERRLRGLSWRHVELELPEFRLTGKSMSLKGPLEALGVKTAFTARADLSGMARPGELRISDVFHKVYVQVDEDGDTGPPDGGGAIAGSPPLPPASFRADRPFMFFIRDIVTDGFLAMGRVSDPRDR
jgi:serpin B